MGSYSPFPRLAFVCAKRGLFLRKNRSYFTGERLSYAESLTAKPFVNNITQQSRFSADLTVENFLCRFHNFELLNYSFISKKTENLPQAPFF